MKNFVKIILWILVVFFVLLALGAMPSISSIFSFLTAVVVAPIEKWQKFIGRYLKKPIRIVLAVVLTIVALLSLPNVESEYDSNLSTDTSISTIADTNESSQINTTDGETETIKLLETSASDETTKLPETSEVPQITEDEDTIISETTIPSHEHEFSVATCVEPSSCSCGEIKEKALGHTWEEATCSVPKTCVSCGITEGDIVGHNWIEATCTVPKICSVCGTKDGNVLGHNWSSATCTSPETCTLCGITQGSALGHNYSNGKCISCGGSDPNYVSEVLVWIPTHGGTKYHNNSSCSKMKDPIQVTKSEAISQGFDACKKCYD